MQDNTFQDIQPFEVQARLLKVLTHPARLAILNILSGGEQCVCHMEAVLGFRQAYISQQLMMLRDAGLIQDRRDGWNVYYRVVEQRIFDVLTAVERITGVKTSPPLSAAACPCPKCSGGAGQ